MNHKWMVKFLDLGTWIVFDENSGRTIAKCTSREDAMTVGIALEQYERSEQDKLESARTDES